MSEQINLLPCPFCGSTDAPRLYTRHGKDGWRDRFKILCDYNDGGCGSSSGWFYYPGEAVECWNRRANSDDLSAPLSCDMALVIAHASDIPMHTERIWMETRAGELWPVQYTYWDGDLLHFLDKYTAITVTVFAAVQYLVTWRCWTKKPSKEQRETVEWNDE